MSEITPTDLIHRPSTINFSRGSCCYAYPARGECPAPVALQVSCDNNNRTLHHNLYMPAVLFVLLPAVLFVLLKQAANSPSCSHNSWPQSTRSPGSRARCAFYLRANSRCARSCCSYNSLNRFPAPNYCTLPTRFRSVVTRLVSINQATRCLSLFCWAPTSGV